MTYSQQHYKAPSEIKEDSVDKNASLIELEPSKEEKEEPSAHNKNTFNSIFNPSIGHIKKLFYGTKAEYYEEE